MQGGRLTAISKKMSYILRHNPPKTEMDAAGFVPLPVLLRTLRDRDATESVVRQIVAGDAKGRFELDDSAAPTRIRAVQGHSVALEAPQLVPVTSADAVPLAIHVTSEEGWAAIQDSGELRRMGRTHIHFATERRHMRANPWASVLLRLNLQQALQAPHADRCRVGLGLALQDGYAFHSAANGVLLCEGPLPVRYVTRIPRDALPAAWL